MQEKIRLKNIFVCERMPIISIYANRIQGLGLKEKKDISNQTH